MHNKNFKKGVVNRERQEYSFRHGVDSFALKKASPLN
jgi:hypothetical protein